MFEVGKHARSSLYPVKVFFPSVGDFCKHSGVVFLRSSAEINSGVVSYGKGEVRTKRNYGNVNDWCSLINLVFHCIPQDPAM